MKKTPIVYYYHFVISRDGEITSFTRTKTVQKLDSIKTRDSLGNRMIGVFVDEDEDRDFMTKINEFVSAL